ncbi:MAG: multicopper oxidase domain-containing protein [Rhodospirillaceae bacterium]|nr:multicopper oxidase domain-containing protein [Rhodospirillaceae bacterium]
MDVGVGQMRVIEFVADAPGDWAFHCHKTHHTMNAMGHEVMTSIGVDFEDAAEKLRRLIPRYMVMGDRGMAEIASMQMELPENTLPMMTGEGPYGPIGMGGMFTVVKVRPDQPSGDYSDPGWYEPPPGTMAYRTES